jgi:phosphoribosylformylglycinamidine synthase
VSLYNETDGAGILPTPTIGAVGLIANADQMIAGDLRDGHFALLVGDPGRHLGQSALLAEAFGREDGDAPAVDLASERRHGDFIRDNHAYITTCTDLSDGGLALAAFETAATFGIGVTLDTTTTEEAFGEDQARYLVTCSFDKAEALMIAAGQSGVSITTVGRFGGDSVTIGGSQALLSDLVAIYTRSFEAAVG